MLLIHFALPDGAKNRSRRTQRDGYQLIEGRLLLRFAADNGLRSGHHRRQPADTINGNSMKMCDACAPLISRRRPAPVRRLPDSIGALVGGQQVNELSHCSASEQGTRLQPLIGLARRLGRIGAGRAWTKRRPRRAALCVDICMPLL